ncbi:hypothetical protein D3C77_418330 [compost metagenome]
MPSPMAFTASSRRSSLRVSPRALLSACVVVRPLRSELAGSGASSSVRSAGAKPLLKVVAARWAGRVRLSKMNDG